VIVSLYQIKDISGQKYEALARLDGGEPLIEIARSYNLSHGTISRLRA